MYESFGSPLSEPGYDTGKVAWAAAHRTEVVTWRSGAQWQTVVARQQEDGAVVGGALRGSYITCRALGPRRYIKMGGREIGEAAHRKGVIGSGATTF
jgi:hypothetical protein